MLFCRGLLQIRAASPPRIADVSAAVTLDNLRHITSVLGTPLTSFINRLLIVTKSKSRNAHRYGVLLPARGPHGVWELQTIIWLVTN